ncbi:RHS repeat-associated core domain-containing protein [Luteibacter sp. UNCMF331Sha3.1]|nr:RHS repeat-associated core domain-containing protein [Luteibacter sp. UNCMF331Sha3.1]
MKAKAKVKPRQLVRLSVHRRNRFLALCTLGAACLFIGPQAFAERRVTYYYVDAQGSPLAEADSAGVVTDVLDYHPYGASAIGNETDSPRYTGHLFDSGTGLLYMQQRYYDAIVGRFLSVDPIRQGSRRMRRSSRYGYADGNPFSFTDPDGRDTYALGVGGAASWLGGVSAQGQLTVSIPSSNPVTWRMGILGSIGGTAGTQLGVGLSAVASWSEANSAEEMAEDGGDASAGGSVNIGPVAFGYEQSMCSECLTTRSVSLGGRLTPLPFEIHTTVAKSAGITLIGTTPAPRLSQLDHFRTLLLNPFHPIL